MSSWRQTARRTASFAGTPRPSGTPRSAEGAARWVSGPESPILRTRPWSGFAPAMRASCTGRRHFPRSCKTVLAALAKEQRPAITILGCSDSRVPPELLFDAGFGELFVVRIAGNVISPEVAGSLQYAAVHLRTPLFVVLGHEGCGAVQAALAARAHGSTAPSRIEVLLQSILPGLEGVAPIASGEGAAPRRCGSERPVEPPADPRIARRRGEAGRGSDELVGAVADLSTGVVRFLDVKR